MNGGRTDSNENDQVSLMTPNSVPFAPRTISSSSSSETTTVLNINGDMDITAVVGAIWGSGENTYRITPHRTGRRQRRRTITNTSSRHSDDDDSTIIIGCQDVVVAEEVKVEIAEEVTIETLIEELKKHQQRNQQPQHHYEQHIESSSSSSSSSDGGGASNKQCVNFKVAGVLLGIAVVIAIILLITKTTVTPTGNPIHPAQAPTYMLDSLEDILQSRSNPIITKSVEIAMSNNTSSPQYKAYHWLQRKENTELQGILSSPSPSMNEINEIIRNYTLNVIYYSMKNSSSQLLDNRDWMKCGTGKCNEHEQTVPACVKCGSTDGALDRLFLSKHIHILLNVNDFSCWLWMGVNQSKLSTCCRFFFFCYTILSKNKTSTTINKYSRICAPFQRVDTYRNSRFNWFGSLGIRYVFFGFVYDRLLFDASLFS